MNMDCMVLCEAVAASLGEWNAKPALAPEFSLRDLEEGRVYEAKDVDDLFKQCLG